MVTRKLVTAAKKTAAMYSILKNKLIVDIVMGLPQLLPNRQPKIDMVKYSSVSTG